MLIVAAVSKVLGCVAGLIDASLAEGLEGEIVSLEISGKRPRA